MGGPGGRGNRRRFSDLNLEYKYMHNTKAATKLGASDNKLRENIVWGVMVIGRKNGPRPLEEASSLLLTCGVRIELA